LGSSQFLLLTSWIIPLSGAFYIGSYWFDYLPALLTLLSPPCPQGRCGVYFPTTLIPQPIRCWLLWRLFSSPLPSPDPPPQVLFTYALLESHLSPAHTRSVFGLFNVSSKVYPWILLVAIQVSQSLLPALCSPASLRPAHAPEYLLCRSPERPGRWCPSRLWSFEFSDPLHRFPPLSLSLTVLVEVYAPLELCCCPYSASWLPPMIPSHDKPLPSSSSTTSSWSLLSSLLSSLHWLLLQLWNLFALLCHVIGLPCDHYLIHLCASTRHALDYLCALLATSLGSRYQPLPTHDISSHTPTNSRPASSSTSTPRSLEV
jgi:hypothetical protein